MDGCVLNASVERQREGTMDGCVLNASVERQREGTVDGCVLNASVERQREGTVDGCVLNASVERQREGTMESEQPRNEVVERIVGVGPWDGPMPDDARFDPELLAEGDRRNVLDEYRYWSREAIVADLDQRRHTFHVAIENWEHDFNIGTMVRNANAFLAAAVHIIGKRRWNRRGAMVTDRYQHVHHHPDFDAFVAWAEAQRLTIVGIDNIEGSVPIETTPLPADVVLLFGQEGPGLSPHAIEVCAQICAITQYGSTRSVNAGVASGIAMYEWLRQHAPGGRDEANHQE